MWLSFQCVVLFCEMRVLGRERWVAVRVEMNGSFEHRPKIGKSDTAHFLMMF